MRKTDQTLRDVKQLVARGWMRFFSLAVLMALAVLVACAQPPQPTEPEASPSPETQASPSLGTETLPSPEVAASPSPGSASSPSPGTAVSPSPEAAVSPAASPQAQVKKRAGDSFRCEVGVDPEDPDALICTARGEDVSEVIVKVPPELKDLTPEKLRWTLEQPEGRRVIVARVINFRVVDAEGTEVNDFQPPIALAVPYTKDDLDKFRDANPDREFMLGYWVPEEQRWIGFNEQPNEFKFVPVPDRAAQGRFVCDQEGSKDPIEEGGFGCATIFALPDPHINW